MNLIVCIWHTYVVATNWNRVVFFVFPKVTADFDRTCGCAAYSAQRNVYFSWNTPLTFHWMSAGICLIVLRRTRALIPRFLYNWRMFDVNSEHTPSHTHMGDVVTFSFANFFFFSLNRVYRHTNIRTRTPIFFSFSASLSLQRDWLQWMCQCPVSSVQCPVQ